MLLLYVSVLDAFRVNILERFEYLPKSHYRAWRQTLLTSLRRNVKYKRTPYYFPSFLMSEARPVVSQVIPDTSTLPILVKGDYTTWGLVYSEALHLGTVHYFSDRKYVC